MSVVFGGIPSLNEMFGWSLGAPSGSEAFNKRERELLGDGFMCVKWFSHFDTCVINTEVMHTFKVVYIFLDVVF